MAGQRRPRRALVPRLRLGRGLPAAPEVRTDWHQWLELVGDDVTSTSTDRLEQALALVQGQPFSNVKAKTVAWAEPLRMETLSSIVDVAREVVRRVLLSRDSDGEVDLPASRAERAALVRRAVRVGRLVDPNSELIWRDALLVEHRAGNDAELRRLTRQLREYAEEHDGELEPETEQLLVDLKLNAL